MPENTTASTETTPKKPRNKWTDIFAQLMGVLLTGYKVEMFTEYELYKEPMRIDVLVVKLLEDVVIKNTIMRNFRKHNIVEFKGPTDTLSIEAFDRVLSYFYAYLSKNSAALNETTVTFVSVRRPVKLLKALREKRGYKIIPSGTDGIYYIVMDGSPAEHTPAMQLIVTGELSAKDVEWLKAVRNDWTAEYCAEILNKIENLKNPGLRDIGFLLCSANPKILKEALTMTVAERKVKEALDLWAVKSGRAEEWKREAAKKTAQQILKFLRSGHSLEEAEAAFA